MVLRRPRSVRSALGVLDASAAIADERPDGNEAYIVIAQDRDLTGANG
jgi:hypothetical protein